MLPLHEHPLLDWSFQTFEFDRKQHVLISNTRTLFSAVFLAGRINTAHALMVAGLAAIEEQLDWHRLLDAYHKQCPAGSQVIRCAKSLNRSVIGSMNELIYPATAAR